MAAARPASGRPPGKGLGVIGKRQQVSNESQNRHSEDVALGDKFDGLYGEAQQAEARLREAQARHAPLAEQRPLAVELDSALTAVMRSAFAAQRAAIGPRGYEERIYRRKAIAPPGGARAAGGGGTAADPAGDPPPERHPAGAPPACRLSILPRCSRAGAPGPESRKLETKRTSPL